MNDTFVGWPKSSRSDGNGTSVEVAAGWRKSSYSGDNANCVQVSSTAPVVGVRDTKQHGEGPVLEFAASAWRTFLDEAKDGRVLRGNL